MPTRRPATPRLDRSYWDLLPRRNFRRVLFLVAVGQRFRIRGVRIAANTVALALLAYALFTISTLPRL